jgi:hypothetical protein
MNSKFVASVAFALVVVVTAGANSQFSFADSDTPPFVPTECEQYEGQPSTAHFLTVVTPGPYLPGDEVEIEAGTTGTGTGANKVRIVAILDGTTVIYENDQLLPNPFGSVSDSFTIPADAETNDSLDIYACFESAGAAQGQGVTHHLGVGSFFVLPESPLGVLALVASSLAVLGGFMVMKRKGSGQMPV